MAASLELQDISIAEQYLIEKLTTAYYSLLSKLYKKAFGNDTSPEEISKRFDTSSLGVLLFGHS